MAGLLLIFSRGEQSCTEDSFGTCHLDWVGEGDPERRPDREWDVLMARTFDELREGVRRWIARTRAARRKRFESLRLPARRVASPRMCPFCGLLTPRSKSSCLECGKSFAPAN